MNTLIIPFSNKSALPPTEYQQLSIEHEASYQLDWCYMKGSPRPCFNPIMLEELQHYATHLSVQESRQVKYMVQASQVPGIFNYGGDLDLFQSLIENQDRDGLMVYARSCINAVFGGVAHFGRNITSIALVQGDALGGGMECALACNILIAEKQAKMGLPEVLFNLFPGMGAYSFLSRKIGPAKAEQFILSGKIYSSEELYSMGIVDILAEEGQGKQAVYDYIRRENRAWNAFSALREVRQHLHPVNYEELLHIAEIWVTAALRLEEKDLRMMERLVTRQTTKLQAQS